MGVPAQVLHGIALRTSLLEKGSIFRAASPEISGEGCLIFLIGILAFLFVGRLLV
jgi:hypothetical protein